MSRSWAKGSTRRYRARRALVLEANQQQNRGRCTVNVGLHCPRHGRPCYGVCTGLAEVVHHARGKAEGDGLDNMVPACAACNGHIGQPGATSPRPTPHTQW
jgi:hypothetical protein